MQDGVARQIAVRNAKLLQPIHANTDDAEGHVILRKAGQPFAQVKTSEVRIGGSTGLINATGWYWAALVTIARGEGDVRIEAERGGDDQTVRVAKGHQMHEDWNVVSLPMAELHADADGASVLQA